mgnify:CR=1 FL=1
MPGSRLMRIRPCSTLMGFATRRGQRGVWVAGAVLLGLVIAKLFTIGHLRTTMIGHALAQTNRYLGCQVLRLNHLGDWGTQFGKLLVGWKQHLDQHALRADPIAEMELIRDWNFRAMYGAWDALKNVDRVLPNHTGKPSEFLVKHIPTQTAPRGLTLSSDGRTAYVAGMLDDAVTVRVAVVTPE